MFIRACYNSNRVSSLSFFNAITGALQPTDLIVEINFTKSWTIPDYLYALT